MKHHIFFPTRVHFLELLLGILRRLGDVEQAMGRHKFGRLVELIEDLPENQRNSPIALVPLARSHFELMDYKKVRSCTQYAKIVAESGAFLFIFLLKHAILNLRQKTIVDCLQRCFYSTFFC